MNSTGRCYHGRALKEFVTVGTPAATALGSSSSIPMKASGGWDEMTGVEAGAGGIGEFYVSHAIPDDPRK